jgi:pimeloyl-ACP methyl ester carboxylesterase
MTLHQRTAKIRGLQTGWWSTRQAQPGKPVLFFLHGFPDDVESWRGQLEKFSSSGYPVIAPYLRGCGPSEPSKDRTRYSRDSVVLDHLEILRQETLLWGEREVFVIGHDIGGMHAWTLARTLGPRLKGLVLVNAPDVGQLLKRVKKPKQLAKSSYIPVFLVRGIADRWFGPDADRSVKVARKRGGLQQSLPLPGDVAPLLEHYRAAFRDFSRIVFQKPDLVKAPVLAIAGKDDAFLEVPTLPEFKNYASQVELRVLDGNHWLQIEQEEQVNRLIQRFVEGAPNAS